MIRAAVVAMATYADPAAARLTEVYCRSIKRSLSRFRAGPAPGAAVR